jgi:glycine/D-amino acid oxidase-like deaminating enzyme
METLIIGGGVVGLSIAYGLLKLDEDVLVINDVTDTHSASRGNFGLIWSQGKGEFSTEYARWTQKSISLWPNLANELKDLTGIDVMLELDGGIEYFTVHEEMDRHIEILNQIHAKSDSNNKFKVLSNSQLKSYVPEIGPKVVGATLQPGDGHVNPLYLLNALSSAVLLKGGKLKNGIKATSIERVGNKFITLLKDGNEIITDRVIIAAGLGSTNIAKMLNFKSPIRPLHGQLMITEKLPHFLRYPSVNIRQVNEGGVQIGGSEVDRGFDDKESLSIVSELARDAVDIFPCLENVNLIRSWGCLRIMTPDGLPIYQQSIENEGAFFITCHSGITLAACHTELLARWIVGTKDAPDLSIFEEDRFDV